MPLDRIIVNVLSEALLEIRLTIHDLKARRGPRAL